MIRAADLTFTHSIAVLGSADRAVDMTKVPFSGSFLSELNHFHCHFSLAFLQALHTKGETASHVLRFIFKGLLFKKKKINNAQIAQDF